MEVTGHSEERESTAGSLSLSFPLGMGRLPGFFPLCLLFPSGFILHLPSVFPPEHFPVLFPGLTNVLGSFLSSFPVTGSFGR